MSTKDHPDWWKNVGGSNALDSLLERRSLVYNDNEVEAPDAPPNIDLAHKDYGKFYSRGMRGKIEELQIYCMRTAGGTLDLTIAPHPCLGPFYTYQVTPGATWAWVAVDPEIFWNYDSLFIWITDIDADVSWGYDQDAPLDGHRSTDDWETWYNVNRRPFIRVLYSSQTPGDVPISGIINNIQIPNVSSVRRNGIAVAVPMAVLTDLIVPYDGAGFLKYLIVNVRASAVSEQTLVYVICDGNAAFGEGYDVLNTMGLGVTTPGVTMTQYAVAGVCTLVFTIPFEFRRELRIVGVNMAGAVTMDAFVYPSLLG